MKAAGSLVPLAFQRPRYSRLTALQLALTTRMYLFLLAQFSFVLPANVRAKEKVLAMYEKINGTLCLVNLAVRIVLQTAKHFGVKSDVYKCP